MNHHDRDQKHWDDERCFIGCPELCSAMHRCPVCDPTSPEFDGRGGGISWWPDDNGVLVPYDATKGGEASDQHA